jgi:hypothetical protein
VGLIAFMILKVSSARLATLGTLIGAGAVGVPVAIFLLSFFLLIPTEATLLAKLLGPFAGGLAVFLFGFWYYIPLSVVIGGGMHSFLKAVGYRSRQAYVLAGPVVGLCVGMITHILAPSVVDELLSGGWSSNAYLVAMAVGGTVLMAIFWTIRRPDKPWDDLQDRRRAGEDI